MMLTNSIRYELHWVLRKQVIRIPFLQESLSVLPADEMSLGRDAK